MFSVVPHDCTMQLDYDEAQDASVRIDQRDLLQRGSNLVVAEGRLRSSVCMVFAASVGGHAGRH